MRKELARVLTRVLRAVYNRLDDVGVSYGPIPPITGLCDQQRYEIEVNEGGDIFTLGSEIAVLNHIKEMTD